MLSSQLYQPKLKHLVGTGTADYFYLPDRRGVVAFVERHGEGEGCASVISWRNSDVSSKNMSRENRCWATRY